MKYNNIGVITQFLNKEESNKEELLRSKIYC